ncbi:hypothetical protein HELRODRAFT_182323 [Helobdella robusta]|uniref:Uncharacterized protein n=1 Tax=Helobdella robusta TaxID=6412 RepID=T1FI23_HELRO|nr:hypothetical protein HELRODRAFT_182323 [Helobdella robusta]ESN91070.1 hypothetical protein HELRODRAFT_182323 [Helobdella robusta]
MSPSQKKSTSKRARVSSLEPTYEEQTFQVSPVFYVIEAEKDNDITELTCFRVQKEIYAQIGDVDNIKIGRNKIIRKAHDLWQIMPSILRAKRNNKNQDHE